MRFSTRFVLFMLCIVTALGTGTIAFAAQNELISAAVDGSPSSGASVNRLSASSDGRFVAFSSAAINLIPDGTQFMQIFVRDAQAGSTEIISVASDGTHGNDASYSPSISGNGRFVAFISDVTNLVPGETQPHQLYLHDRQNGQTELIPAATDWTYETYWYTESVISADGRFVAYVTLANVLEDGTQPCRICVYDRQTGSTESISSGPHRNQLAMSADGRYMVFKTHDSTSIYVHDRQTGQTKDVGQTSYCDSDVVYYNDMPSISGDGRFIVYKMYLLSLSYVNYYDLPQIILYDQLTGIVEPISISDDGIWGDQPCSSASISDDGRFVTFLSNSANLSAESVISTPAYIQYSNVFLHDRLSGKTRISSFGYDGGMANGSFYDGCISGNGQYVIFDSIASNMIADHSSGLNVFRRDIAPDIAGVSIKITTPTEDPVGIAVDQTLTMEGTASADAGLSSVTWSTDRGESGICTETTSWNIVDVPLHAGKNLVTVTAEDTSGIEQTVERTVIYDDTTPPALSITTPTSDATYLTSCTTLNIGGTASDDMSPVRITWSNDRGGNGSTLTSSAWNVKNISIKPGLNVITVTATDASGNKTTVTLTVTFADSIPPTVNITSPTTSGSYTTNSQMLAFSATALDNGTVTRVSWVNDRGGSGAVTGTSSLSGSTNLQPGVNVITVTATDAAGNIGSSTLTVTYTDTTPPTVNIASPTGTGSFATASGSLNISGNASDNIGVTSVIWTNARGGNGICDVIKSCGVTSWSGNIVLQPGVNVITVTAIDLAGNEASSTLTVNADYIPPTVKVTVPTTASTYTTTSQVLLLRGTTSDNGTVASVSWANDRGGSGTCSGTTYWSRSIKFLPGVNIITLTATDVAGNKGTTTLTVNYTDITPPTVKVIVPTTASTYTTTSEILMLRGTTSDNGTVSSVSWVNDRGGSGTCSGTTYWSRSIKFLPGVNVITITATDALGNKGTTTLTVNYTDITPPTVKVTLPTTAATYTTTNDILMLRGTAADNVAVSSVSWANDRGGSGLCSGTIYWVRSIKFFPGVNVITLTATDVAGNKGSASIQITR